MSNLDLQRSAAFIYAHGTFPVISRYVGDDWVHRGFASPDIGIKAQKLTY